MASKITSHMVDITGQRFGRLIAIKPTGRKRGTSAEWECKCDCGNTTNVSVANLKTGKTKSCGCIYRERLVDITGQKFGRLTVIEKYGNRPNGAAIWKCQCDCSNITYATGTNLRKGNIQSCGCLKKE